jgi:hypothetical protein
MAMPAESTAVLVSMPTEAEAVLLIQALHSHGIAAQAVGALTSGFRAEAPGQVQTLVRTDDMAAAQAIMRELRD